MILKREFAYLRVQFSVSQVTLPWQQAPSNPGGGHLPQAAGHGTSIVAEAMHVSTYKRAMAQASSMFVVQRSFLR